jgi:hypothetical protein
MIDLHNKQDRGRLLKAVKTSREALEPFRRVRKQLIKDYVGSWYSEGGSEVKILTNLLYQTAKIYTVALAANNPQAMVETPFVEFMPFARRYEVALNKLISDMNLATTFRAVILDAFFCIGCVVVMMRDSGTQFHGILESEEDVWLDPGEPWLNRVSTDDLILDMTAKEVSKMRFCGHRYRADFQKAKEEPGYNREAQEKLTPTSKNTTDDPDVARDIAAGVAVDDDELKPMVWFQDIWIPENNAVATLAVDQPDLPPLIERDWVGSQAGPYKFLSLGLVPDNVMPVSPAMNLKPLHDLQNRLHRRMEDDSDAHRVVNAYPPGGEDEAELLRTAERNSWKRIGSPKDIAQIEMGGVDQRDQAFSMFVQDEYDRFAGNLQVMGGLGPQAATLGQEELTHGQVSRMEADMRMAVVEFAGESILDLGRLMWEDQQLEIYGSTPLGSSGYTAEANWLPGERLGNPDDYGLRVEPYSMVFKTPEQKLQELYQTLREIAPLWPMFQASGATLDAKAILDEIARLKNRPEFKQFITFGYPPTTPGGPPTQSPVTTRENVRRNIPTGGTRDARSAILQQTLAGGGKPQVNGQQRAAMTRAPA